MNREDASVSRRVAPPEAWPSGVVAFLVTDIEGSTRLWETNQAGMWRAIAQHNLLLDQAISAHQGVRFKMVGDAYLAAFHDVRSAIATAVAAQRALAAADWPETGPIRVRMAVHAGDAAPVQGDYPGATLTRAGQLLAAGYGGQVLLSGVAHDLAGQALPPGVTVRDMGRHRLRDLLEPEAIWQLETPGLPADFPPLKSLDRHPTNLPVQPNPLVGRDADLAALAPLLVDPAVRLLTLLGPGGVGKTRLALQAAADALPGFADGVFLVELAALTKPPLVLPRIAASLGVQESGALGPRDALLAWLAPKRLLLVLDNLEQIRPEAELGRELNALLNAAPGLTLLVTSRSPVHLQTEREYPVSPLAVPDSRRTRLPEDLKSSPAVALFAARAAAVNPSFALTPENARIVAEICARLDGMPLAIELAAARARVLTPAGIHERLERQLDLLTSRGGDRPDRQQTLRAAIDWSYELLSPEEQAFFRRLAVFAGGFTLEAVEAVIGEPREPTLDALDGIDELLNESLLRATEQTDGATRYQMLESLRAFARERLDAAGETASARIAHARYFSAWARASNPHVTGPEPALWLDRFERDHDNFRAALQQALDTGEPEPATRIVNHLWRFWIVRGHWSEGRSWLERALAADGPAAGVDRWLALRGLGSIASSQGDYPTAERVFREALVYAKATDNAVEIASLLNNLATLYDWTGRAAESRQMYTEAAALIPRLNNPGLEGQLLNNLGLAELVAGNLDEAAIWLERSLALKRKTGNKLGAAVTLANLNLIEIKRKNLTTARRCLEESLAVYREAGDQQGVSDLLLNLATLHELEQDHLGSARFRREALTIQRAIQYQYGVVFSLEGTAISAARVGFPEAAARLLGASASERIVLGTPIGPIEREEYDGGRAVIEQMLGDDAFARLFAEGETMSVDDAVALAETTLDQILNLPADRALTAPPLAVSP